MALTYTEFLETNGFTDKTIFCKLLNNEQRHHGFQYKLGLNIDCNKFYPKGSCRSGGLYFTVDKYLHRFIHFGINIAIIKLCEDALFYIDPDPEDLKFKTNKFEIVKVYQTENICKIAVRENGFVLRYVINQTEEICKLAVQQDGRALQYVIKQTDEICKLAVQQHGFALLFVKNQTIEICKLAVQRNLGASYFARL